MTRLRGMFALGLVWLMSGCGAHEPPSNAKYVQTTASVRAPLNIGGAVAVMRRGHEHELPFRGRITPADARIDEAGNARFDLWSFEGDVTVEVVGGHYADPVTGRTVSMRGETLHGYARDIQLLDNAQIVVTPWTELLYRYMRQHPETADIRAAEDALVGALGCGTRILVRAFPAQPSESTPLFIAGDAELAYVHLGAWSKLAQAVSLEVGRGEDGVSVMQLTRAIGDVIDRLGYIAGPIEVAPDKTVASDLLRQRFAHAMRHFVEAEPKHVSLRTDPLKSFLECTSQAPADMWGPAGEALDVVGPVLQMDGPAVFAAPLQVRCQAQDDSTVQSISIEVVQGGQAVHPRALPKNGNDVSGIGSPVATLLATLNPDYLDDGPIRVTCHAADRWGNATDRAIDMAVNRRLGRVTPSVDAFEMRNERPYVQGTVTVSCVCDDAYLVADNACGLSPDAQAIAGMGKGTMQRGRAVYIWDTTQGGDGARELVCEGRSGGLDAPIISAPQYVWVGNFNRVTVIGDVRLDSLVEGMRVTAYAFGDGRRGEVLGTADAPNGEFALSISNEYAGPLLLEAAPVHALGAPKPSYTSLAFGEPLFVDTHRLSLLWDFYSPAQTMPQVLHIHAATSLAETLAVGMYRQAGGGGDDKIADASQWAHALVGQHIQPDGSLDPRLTAVADLADKRAATGANNVLLGLFHAGLSRLAAEQGREGPRYYSGLDLLAKLRDDALSGMLDGREATGHDSLFLGRYPLSTETLRRDLASATRRWLRNDTLHGKEYAMSGLSLRAYSRPGQYLVTLSADDSQMFGGAPGKAFDEDGPELTLRVRQDGDDMDWTDMPEERTFRGAIDIDVRAEDDSDVMDFQVLFGDTPLRDDGKEGDRYALETPNAHGTFTVNTALFPDGDIDILLTARDRLGNVSQMPMVISIDNTPPEVQTATSVLVRDGNFRLIGTASKELASLSATLLGGTQQGEVILREGASGEPGRGFDVAFSGLPCNQSYVVALTAKDSVGNLSEPQHVTVVCDNESPTIRIESSEYTQKASKKVVKIGPTSPTEPLEVFVHEMDSTAENLPTLRFVVDDQVGRKVGSLPSELRVEVAVKRNRSWMRDWEPLDATLEQRQQGTWSLPISYQMLLPRTVIDSPSIAYARAHNHVALGNASDAHTILLRVVDTAGNVSVPAEIDIMFKMLSVPVTMSCDMTAAAQASRVDPPTVMRFSKGKEAFFNVSLDWPARSPSPTSLAPEDGQVVVMMEPTTTRWLATETLFEREITFKSDRAYPRNFPDAWPCKSPRKWTVYRERGGCSASDDRLQGISSVRHPDRGFSQKQVPSKELVTVNAFSTSSVEFMGGSVSIETGIGSGSHARPQLSAHRGWELERSPGWYQEPDRSEFVEREMVTGFMLTRAALARPKIQVQGMYPAPVDVVMDDSCKKILAVHMAGSEEAKRFTF